jgi:hypothetical protein
MRKLAFTTLAVGVMLGLAFEAGAQSASGSLEIEARITPTAAKPEPVRQFTFYILRRSYAEIVRELEEKDPPPSRDTFIEGLKLSLELQKWLKAHDIMDLTLPDLDKQLTTEDVLGIPEFLHAYQRANSGGVTPGFPQPKYTETDKAEHPEKYEKQKLLYMTALKKFILAHPESVSGIELELSGINPQAKWATTQNDRRRRLRRNAPEAAQLRYLAAKLDTDLDGRARVSGLPAGRYWISTLNLRAEAGDLYLNWDVPVEIVSGQTARLELTNLNAADTQGNNP